MFLIFTFDVKNILIVALLRPGNRLKDRLTSFGIHTRKPETDDEAAGPQLQTPPCSMSYRLKQRAVIWGNLRPTVVTSLSFINTMLLFCTLSELFRVSLWTLNVSFTCFTPLRGFFFFFDLFGIFLGPHRARAYKDGAGGATAPPPRTEQRRLRWKAKGLANVQKLWPGRIKQLKLLTHQDVDKGVA